jgi:hypothetical protein
MGAVMPAGTARVVACRASSKERAGRSGQPRTWPLDPAPVRSDSAPFQPPAAVREVSPAAANGDAATVLRGHEARCRPGGRRDSQRVSPGGSQEERQGDSGKTGALPPHRGFRSRVASDCEDRASFGAGA